MSADHLLAALKVCQKKIIFLWIYIPIKNHKKILKLKLIKN